MSAVTWRRFSDLVRLRYRLQWAQVRSSPTRVAFFALIQFALVLILLIATLVTMGGTAAAASAGRLAEFTRIALGVVFLNTLVASTMLGFGMNQVFSEPTLRRYPLTRSARLAIRHALGLVEPLWLCTVVGYLGCAIGASLLGPSPIWFTVPTALLLVVVNLLLARLVLALGERLAASAIGSFVLLAAFQSIFLLPLALGRSSPSQTIRGVLLGLVEWTPPSAAAAIMSRTQTWVTPLVLVGWGLAIGAALMLLESRPVAIRRAAGSTARWDTPYDRAASLFPGVRAPLVGRALRYYLRNPRLRMNLVIVLPLLAVVAIRASPRQGVSNLFERALLFGGLLVPLLSTSFSANVFGYEGSGFKRLLLAPVRARMLLRAVAMVPLLIGTAYIVMAAMAWLLFAPVPTDARMLVMLIAHMLTSMVVFHAFALWSSVLSPKRVSYGQKFRDEMSIGGYVVTFVGILSLLTVPIVLRSMLLRGPIEQHWWVPLLTLLAGVVLYELMFRAASSMLARRRERLLSIVEGRR